jgi:hypothetical protein
MLMAQYDDDPNPYHGDYSEDWWDGGAIPLSLSLSWG